MQFAPPTPARLLRSACLPAALVLLLWPAFGYAGTSTTTSLSLSSASVSSGSAITLTATVLAGATLVHPGSIVFCNASATRCADSAIIGTAQLTSSGTAAVKIVPGLGTHSYSAVFKGTTTYTTSTSSSASVTVTGYYPTTTTYTTSGSAGAYTLTATVTSYSNLPSYPYGTMDFEDASNGNYLFGTGSVGSGSYAEAFSLTGTNSTSSTPRRSATADFNGDGIPDVVVASQSGADISVFLGSGNGTFSSASGSPISTGSQTVAVATGDFNGDGKVDIAVASYGSNTISILLGNGDGTFTAGTSLTGFNTPVAIAVADLNLDGNLDLAVVSQNGNVVCDYLGTGAGGFTFDTCFSTGSAPYSVVAADFNGDGKLDLAVGNHGASSVTVLLGDGTGNFTAATGSPVTVGTNPWNLVALDLNNDGKVDLVASDGGDANLSTLLGNGDGTFATYTTYALAAGTKEIAAGDFNGDGNMDVAVCNYSNSTLNIALGGGNGYFFAGPSVALGASGCSGLAAADFNGDGLTDVEASLQGNNTSTVLINQIEHSASASFGPGAIPGHGSHNIFAYYPGDYANAASASANTALTATPATTALALSAVPTSSTYSQQVALSATLSPYIEGNQTTAGETVTFYNGGTSLGTASLSTGVASLNVTSLPVGTDSLTASYPGDSNYNSSTSSASSYTVSKATPTITWTAPSAITYGTALSATQLNATSGGVAGTFVYTPASGTLLNAGAGQTLSVAFTPTNTASYNSATGSTTITVNRANPVVALSTSSASISNGTAITLTASAQNGSTAITQGTVVFCNASATYCTGSAALGRAQLTSAGTAAIKFIPGIGSHSYKTVFTAQKNYTSTASPSVTVVVSGSYKTATTLAATGSAGSYSLTSTVDAIGALATGPTGNVSFNDATNSNYTLGTAAFGASALTSGFNDFSQASLAGALLPSATADFNGDGIPDLAIPIHTNAVTILLGVGDGTFTTGSTITLGIGSQDAGVIAADLNGDGKMDLACWSQNANDLIVALGNGDGTFQTPTVISVSNSPTALIAADFNGDGILDLAFTQSSSNNIEILYGDGTGAYPSNRTISVGSLPYGLVAADFNGDGYADIAVANASSNNVTILLNDGTGNFAPASGSPVSVGSLPVSVYSADLNNDGNIDLVVENVNAATLSILLGNGSGGFTVSTLAVSSTSDKRVVIADFNGDGSQDIAVCYNSISQLSLNLGNNDGTFQALTSTAVPASGCAFAVQADFNGDGLPDLELSLHGNGTQQFLLNTTGLTASASISPVSIPGNGSHNITAAYAGNSGDLTSTSATISLTASPVTTALSLSAAPSSDNYGQSVTLTATLSPYLAGGLTTAGETITFKSGGATIGTGTLAAGVATLTLTSLGAGSDSLTAVYAADSNFLGSTSNTVTYAVAKTTPTITWTAPSAITYGTALSGTQLNATSGGVAGTFVYTPASGTVLNAGAGQTLSVAFTPTDPTSYNSANGTTIITVNQATPTITVSTSAASAGYGSAVTFTATLTSGATGTVTFRDSGNSIGTGTISGTAATFTTSSLSVGSHTITVSWPGNTNFVSGTSAAVTQTIVRSAATLVELSSPNPSLFGDTVSLSLTATGGGVTPTGTVTLTNNGTTVTTITLSASGTASYAISTLTAGTHALKFTYNGDVNYF